MRYVNLKNLPKRVDSLGREVINWGDCCGEKCYFEFDDIKGYIEIIDTLKKGKHTYVEFKINNKNHVMRVDNFKDAKFSRVFKIRKGKCKSSDFKYNINDIIKAKDGQLIILDRKIEKKKYPTQEVKDKYYLCKCSCCGYEIWKPEGSINKLTGCPVCCVPPKLVIKGINDIATTDPWMMKYMINYEDAYKYSSQSNECIKVKCINCGYEKNMSICGLYKRKHVPCVCSMGSYAEKLFYHIVNIQFDLDMIFQASKKDFKWMENFRYDFVDSKNKIIWELDGGLGHGKKIHSKSNETIEDTIRRDKTKDKLAMENGFTVIRIDVDYPNYDRFDFIKTSIMSSPFPGIYNVYDINFSEAHKFACYTNKIHI